MRDYYNEINTAISRYENFQYADKKIGWICDRIAWCWKFRHITEEQMADLCSRMIDVMEIYKEVY